MSLPLENQFLLPTSSQVPPWDELWQYGGEYRAVANNSLGSADCRTFLLLDTPLRLRPVDSSKPAIAGRFHDLKCYFIGCGIPKVREFYFLQFLINNR